MSAVTVRMAEFLHIQQDIFSIKEEEVVSVCGKTSRQNAAAKPRCNWKLGAFYRLALLVVQ